MKKYEVEFKLKSKGIFGVLDAGNNIQTLVISANSASDAEKRIKAMYSDKSVTIYSCKCVW